MDSTDQTANPEWVTLREASFITGEPEEALWRRVEAGELTTGDQQIDHLGVRFLMVRVRDLVSSGLLTAGLAPTRAGPGRLRTKLGRVAGRPAARAPAETSPIEIERPGWTQLRALLARIPREGGRPIFVNDESSASTWSDRHAGDELAGDPVGGSDTDDRMVASGPGRGRRLPAASLPRWMTISEAAFLGGVDEEDLRRGVEQGRVASDPTLTGRLGPRFLLLRTDDLLADGWLGADERARASPSPAIGASMPLAPRRPDHLPARAIAHSREGPRAHPARGRSAARKDRRTRDPRRPGRGARILGRAFAALAVVAEWTAVTLIAGLLVLTALPQALGYRTFVATSHGMEPALHRGDLLIERVISPAQARIDDIVTFRDPADRERLVTERVQTVHVGKASVRIETLADRGGAPTKWSVPPDGRISRVAFHVPKVGSVADWFVQPWHIAVVVLPLLVVAWMERVRRGQPRFVWASR